MNKLLLSFVLAGTTLITAYAQAPKGINYQGVARDSEGKPIISKNISVRISILKSAANGEVEYSETHKPQTNQFGLFALVIGQGTAGMGSFGFVSWAVGNKWLQIEIDPDGGSSFQLAGSQQLMSVPYAFYSEYSGNSSSLMAGQGISINNNVISNTGDGDNSSTNELITGASLTADKKLRITDAGGTKEVDLNTIANTDNQSLTLTGTSLAISGGNTVNLASVFTDGQNLSLGTPSGTNRTINITNGTGVTLDVADNDNNSTNEIQTLSKAGAVVSLSNGGGAITLNDDDATNEIQDLALNTGTNILSLTNDATTIDLTPYKQSLSLTGTTLGISGSNSINLGSINTDGQNLSLGNPVGTNRTINITNGTSVTLDVADNDNSSTNEIQTLSKAGTVVSLSNGGGAITLNDDDATNEIQALAKTGATISLSNGGGSVVLNDDNATNEIQDLSLNAGTNVLSLTNDATSVDLTPYKQNLIYTPGTNSLAISSGNSVTISSTLTQVLTTNPNAGGIRIQNMGTPTSNADATTKGYVDTAIITAISTNYAFKTTYSYTNTGVPLTDSPIPLAKVFDDFNVIGTNRFTAPVAGTYYFTVTGSSPMGSVPIKLKVTSGSISFFEIKKQQSYPDASIKNYQDSNIYKLNAGDTVELVVTSLLLGERVEGILFGYKL